MINSNTPYSSLRFFLPGKLFLLELGWQCILSSPIVSCNLPDAFEDVHPLTHSRPPLFSLTTCLLLLHSSPFPPSFPTLLCQVHSTFSPLSSSSDTSSSTFSLVGDFFYADPHPEGLVPTLCDVGVFWVVVCFGFFFFFFFCFWFCFFFFFFVFISPFPLTLCSFETVAPTRQLSHRT